MPSTSPDFTKYLLQYWIVLFVCFYLLHIGHFCLLQVYAKRCFHDNLFSIQALEANSLLLLLFTYIIIINHICYTIKIMHVTH